MEAMEMKPVDLFGNAYSGKRVLITGHTGFKGSWLALWLAMLGAEVTGFALPPESPRGNYELSGLKDIILDIHGDIRDKEHLQETFEACRPEIVFHLAAQPIVRDSYRLPAETFETNVMGTVNVLENVRLSPTTRAAVIVTSDKCYENREQIWGYREGDPMGGHDPYSASKGCAELVCAAYRRSFFSEPGGGQKGLATARAGNVIGGGDWAPHRIIPDCARALLTGWPIEVRNPNAVRPWQFVLEPLYGYLLLAARLLEDPERFSGPWNFGPDIDSVVPVGRVVDKVITRWGSGTRTDRPQAGAVHEAGLLSLDCTKARALLGWKPLLTLDQALDSTLAWYVSFAAADVTALCEGQIADYCSRRIAERAEGGAG